MQVNTGGSAGSGCLPVNGRWQGGQAGHGPLSGCAQLVQPEYPSILRKRDSWQA